MKHVNFSFFFFIFSMPTLQKIESGKIWSPAATPTLVRSVEQEKLRDSLKLEDLKIATPKVNIYSYNICL